MVNIVDWFEALMGFRETSYEETRDQLALDGARLCSLRTGASYAIGELELVSLQALRDRAKSGRDLSGWLRVSVVEGDVRSMHQLSENVGAMFQVASQFNLLEMASPDVAPEHGVTRYQYDPTQGPACAIAAGAATIYRNYFALVDGVRGQTATKQLDGIADLGKALSKSMNLPIDNLWTMKNGYALGKEAGVNAISRYLGTLHEDQIDSIRQKLRIGLHWDVEVTEARGAAHPLVSQAFCSALPASYSRVPDAHWSPFAQLVLEAAYEATMWAAVINAQRRSSNGVLLTLLGGGAFGNQESWIHAAIRRSLDLMRSYDLDVKLVSYRTPSKPLLAIAERFQ